MSIRRRAWTTKAGVAKQAYVVDYADQHGVRHNKQFGRQKEAVAYQATVRIEVGRGTHTPDSASITVAQAAENWLTTCEGHGLERSTLTMYREHVRLHIVPYLGRMKLSQLSAPLIRQFEDRLRIGTSAPGEAAGKARSSAMLRKIRSSLGSILADAMERGNLSHNAVRELRSSRRRGIDRRADRRQKGKLKIGVDVPSAPEVKAFLAALQGRYHPILMTTVFTGLRASELRGLQWPTLICRRTSCTCGGGPTATT